MKRVTLIFENPRERDRACMFADLFGLTWTLSAETRDGIDGPYPVWRLVVTDMQDTAA